MYADIVINTKIIGGKNTFTYAIPQYLQSDIQVGMLVSTTFKGKVTNGIVIRVHSDTVSFKTIPIKNIIYTFPVLSSEQIELVKFIASTYQSDYLSCIKLFPNFTSPLKIPDPTEQRVQPHLSNITLTEEQSKALETLRTHPESFHLLHGRTGSGKTEIYIRLIADRLKEGKQAILLVPEISLTPQIVNNIIKVFGKENVLVYHSKVNKQQKVINPTIPIVIGTRSALFYPLANLGLIIIDEAHDNSYKQDKNPRYHAVKIAEYLHQKKHIQVVLGTATPTVEQYYNALQEKYALITLNTPVHINRNIHIHIVNLKEAKQTFQYITTELTEHIQRRITNQEQSIIYLNRRGIASAIICNTCRETIQCPRCNIPLTLHRKILLCHHCNFAMHLPQLCPKCQSSMLKPLGTGTQDVEYRLKTLFNNVNILRMDTDSTRTGNRLNDIYKSLQQDNPHIIVGTQMVTKGWDLPNVTLVGVVLFDTDLFFPDFRANEHAYNILTQVIGRGGRNTKPTDIFIQTYIPNSPILDFALKADYRGFYNSEIEKRKWLNYPPFTDLTKILIQHQDDKKCREKAKKIRSILVEEKREDVEILGPVPCFHPLINNKYRMQIILKTPRDENILRNQILGKIEQDTSITIDCDPINLL